MSTTEQLKQLLTNAIKEGFTAEDIEDLARDIEIEQEAEEEANEYIDELQDNAAAALTDFLFEIGYFDKEEDIDDCTQSIYKALQLVRDGDLKVSVKDHAKSCTYRCSKDNELEKFLSILKKFY